MGPDRACPGGGTVALPLRCPVRNFPFSEARDPRFVPRQGGSRAAPSPRARAPCCSPAGRGPVPEAHVEANQASYEWARDPEGKGGSLFRRRDPRSGEPCNLYDTLNRSTEDLLQRAAAGLYAAERLGTCIYRCVGCDAFNALAATTFEMDRDPGIRGEVSWIRVAGAGRGDPEGHETSSELGGRAPRRRNVAWSRPRSGPENHGPAAGRL